MSTTTSKPSADPAPVVANAPSRTRPAPRRLRVRTGLRAGAPATALAASALEGNKKPPVDGD